MMDIPPQFCHLVLPGKADNHKVRVKISDGCYALMSIAEARRKEICLLLSQLMATLELRIDNWERRKREYSIGYSLSEKDATGELMRVSNEFRDIIKTDIASWGMVLDLQMNLFLKGM